MWSFFSSAGAQQQSRAVQVRLRSTARISVLQQQWPVHPNELTLALRAKTSGSCQERSLAA
jgi:hypothetical protein